MELSLPAVRLTSEQKLPRILVESTMIRSVGYHPVEFILEMEFRGKYYLEIWHYYGVPHWVPLGLVGANSKGSYYLNCIKGRFEARTVPDHEHLFLTPGYRQRTVSAGGGISGGVSHLWPWSWNEPPQAQDPAPEGHTGPGWQGTGDGRLWAGTPEGKAWMEHHYGLLASALEAHGMQVPEVPQLGEHSGVPMDGRTTGVRGNVLQHAMMDPKFRATHAPSLPPLPTP